MYNIKLEYNETNIVINKASLEIRIKYQFYLSLSVHKLACFADIYRGRERESLGDILSPSLTLAYTSCKRAPSVAELPIPPLPF